MATKCGSTKLLLTGCVSFLTTKEDCRVFAKENVLLNSVQKPPQERRQHRKQQPPRQRKPVTPTPRNLPPSSCFRCGDLHWNKDCAHVNHKCGTCKRLGHLESVWTLPQSPFSQPPQTKKEQGCLLTGRHGASVVQAKRLSGNGR